MFKCLQIGSWLQHLHSSILVSNSSSPKEKQCQTWWNIFIKPCKQQHDQVTSTNAIMIDSLKLLLIKKELVSYNAPAAFNMSSNLPLSFSVTIPPNGPIIGRQNKELCK